MGDILVMINNSIRQAKEEDLDRILELGKEFGHLMDYQTTEEGLLPHLATILVYEVDTQIKGYFHYVPVIDHNSVHFVVATKGFPDILKHHLTLKVFSGGLPIVVCMQGAGHREVFREFITYLKFKYEEIWSWCSIKSKRPESYKELGFSYNPDIKYTFYNSNAGRDSTYRLGVWRE